MGFEPFGALTSVSVACINIRKLSATGESARPDLRMTLISRVNPRRVIARNFAIARGSIIEQTDGSAAILTTPRVFDSRCLILTVTPSIGA